MAKYIELTDEQLKEIALSEEDLEMIAKAEAMPVTFDEDCPEVTPETAMKFRRVNPLRVRTA